jgi:hypothetical protein
MSVTTKQDINKRDVGNNYTPEGKFLSLDEIIDIYKKGCDDGYLNYINKMRKELTKNLTEAQRIAENFLSDVNSKNEICNNIFLRVIDINKFDLLYAIEPDIFYNPAKSKEYYEKGLDYEDENPTISISFLPYADNLNTNMLIADRFLYFYGGQKQFN